MTTEKIKRLRLALIDLDVAEIHQLRERIYRSRTKLDLVYETVEILTDTELERYYAEYVEEMPEPPVAVSLPVAECEECAESPIPVTHNNP